eukprot:CAMPEP_0205830738 /NCGR_PEP_ID=MMETSP0206-20130828/42049_1 /ASSEMBLY_ACC=CAM_ASM_000279 /TAXON_ID=36767 /ORGANISM="Euplotes focardii, Strain TN1" /LENGTH=114 /DNA_ID=CAMNT_0053134689 /DNA_START=3 /DNA_END=343 /DNA_ORIENTATION=-
MAQEGTASALKAIEKIIKDRLTQIKAEFLALPDRIDTSHNFRSVAGAASHSAIGKRPKMEDDEVVVDSFCGEPGTTFFGLYDGHGGRATVDFVVKTLHMNLEQYMRRNPAAAVR